MFLKSINLDYSSSTDSLLLAIKPGDRKPWVGPKPMNLCRPTTIPGPGKDEPMQINRQPWARNRRTYVEQLPTLGLKLQTVSPWITILGLKPKNLDLKPMI